MAVRIRLRRIGKKKQPQYRFVVAEAHGPRDGRFIEIIGSYDPRREPSHVAVDEERTLVWLRNGAQATEPVERLLKVVGVWQKFTGQSEAPAAPAPPVEEQPSE